MTSRTCPTCGKTKSEYVKMRLGDIGKGKWSNASICPDQFHKGVEAEPKNPTSNDEVSRNPSADKRLSTSIDSSIKANLEHDKASTDCYCHAGTSPHLRGFDSCKNTASTAEKPDTVETRSLALSAIHAAKSKLNRKDGPHVPEAIEFLDVAVKHISLLEPVSHRSAEGSAVSHRDMHDRQINSKKEV